MVLFIYEQLIKRLAWRGKMEVLIGCLVLVVVTGITGIEAASSKLAPESEESESVRLELLKQKLSKRV